MCNGLARAAICKFEIICNAFHLLMSPISPTLACVRVRVRVHEPLSARVRLCVCVCALGSSSFRLCFVCFFFAMTNRAATPAQFGLSFGVAKLSKK